LLRTLRGSLSGQVENMSYCDVVGVRSRASTLFMAEEDVRHVQIILFLFPKNIF